MKKCCLSSCDDDNGAWLDSVLPHWTHSVRTIQRSVIQDGTCDFRRSSRFGSWADPFPHLHCRSRTRGPKAWFQRSCICGRPANLRSHSSIRHGQPATTNGRLYRGCLHLDVLESTMPQSLEDWTHLVGIISTASELCHGHRNERSGISHSSGRLGQRSRPYLVGSCQQSRRVVLLPYSTTLHRSTNIDGWGCTLPGTSLHPQPDWLLQRYFGFQPEIPHWEATVGASCRRQTRLYDCPVARPYPLWCAINFTGSASNQEWSLSWLSWLTSRFTVWLRSTCLPTVFQCRACRVAHIFDLLISGPCSSPELRLWQSALGVFTVHALAYGTPCLRLFVTSICHWRLSGVN